MRPLFKNLASELAARIAPLSMRGRGIIVGLAGAQGSGKSTLAAALQSQLRIHHGKSTAVVSLDDLYLSRSDRAAMAATTHRLLATRGPPGTHDVNLGKNVLTKLVEAKEGDVTFIPRFDKALDDRLPRAQWTQFKGRADIVVFEGWCVGATPQDASALCSPVNALEAIDDADRVWRNWVNTALASDYQDLFGLLGPLIMLKAPSFDVVAGWRLEQERSLRSRLNNANGPGLLTDPEVRHFTMYFERITRHMLAEMPTRADALVALDDKRKPIDVLFAGDGRFGVRSNENRPVTKAPASRLPPFRACSTSMNAASSAFVARDCVPKTVIAIDIGGSHIAAGQVEAGAVVEHLSITADATRGLLPLLPKLESIVRSFGNADAVAVGFPGSVRKGIVTKTLRQKYEDAEGFDFAAWSQRAFGLPARVSADGRVALLAEWRLGAGRGRNNLVWMGFGTGVGTAAVVDGVLLEGAEGLAAILGGHLTLDRRQDIICRCGLLGCPEAQASTWAVQSKTKYANIADLFAAGSKEAPTQQALLETWGDIASLLALAFDPQAIIVGGGAGQLEPLLETLRARVTSLGWRTEAPEVLQAELADNGPLLGAALLWEQRT